MVKISAVMPTHNRDKIIGESIQSIIDQTENNWELIIVDDHSDAEDKTEAVVKSFADERIFYIKLDDKFGRGIAAARNFGVMLAKGEYIAVLDSDDINYPNRFELSIEALDAGYDLVYGEIDVWNPETGETHNREGDYAATDFNLQTFRDHNYIPNPTAAYKRIWAVDFPYNTFFRVAEDYDFFSRIQKYGAKFKFIKEGLVKYRSHEGSISRSKDFEFNYGDVVKYNRGWKEDKPEIFGR